MNFQGSGKRVDDYDIPRIGALIGVVETKFTLYWTSKAQARASTAPAG